MYVVCPFAKERGVLTRTLLRRCYATASPSQQLSGRIAQVASSILKLNDVPLDAAHLVRNRALDPQEPLRVLILGDDNVGVSKIINVMLHSSSAGDSGFRLASRPEKLTRIVQGGSLTVEDTDAMSTVRMPSPILDSLHLLVPPPLREYDNDSESMDKLLASADYVVLVTDTARQLASQREEQFLTRNAARVSAVVINGADFLEDETAELPSIIQNVNQRLQAAVVKSTGATDAAGPAPRVLAVSTRRAALAQYLVVGQADAAVNKTAQSDLEDSNVPTLARLLTESAVSQTRLSLKLDASLSILSDTLSRLSRRDEDILARLHEFDRTFQAILEDVLRDEKRMVADFQKVDLAVVDDNVKEVKERVRRFFDEVNFWKLFWRLDDITAVLRHAFGSTLLSEAEHKMSYSTGKLNAATHHVFSLLRYRLSELAAASDYQRFEATSAMQSTITRLVEQLDREQLNVEQRQTPYTLSNIVWEHRTKFDQGDKINEVQSHAESLVLKSAAVQGLGATVGVASYLSDIAPLLSVGSGVAVAGVGLALMKRRWEAFEDDFIRSNTTLQDSLKAELNTKFKALLTEQLVEPIATLVDIYDEMLQHQIKEAEARKATMLALRADVQEMMRENV
ncbi:hypothetical protein RI367_006952 [Sorochytrium milnesiophthora]